MNRSSWESWRWVSRSCFTRIGLKWD